MVPLDCRSHWNMRLDPVYPEFAMLAERPRHIIEFLGVRFPDARSGVIRLDQGHPGIHDICCAITPRAILWLPDLVRQIDGWECMRLQGIWIDPGTDFGFKLMQDFGSFFACDIAGNAFSTIDCMRSIIVAPTGVAIGESFANVRVDDQILSERSGASFKRGDSFVFSQFDPGDDSDNAA